MNIFTSLKPLPASRKAITFIEIIIVVIIIVALIVISAPQFKKAHESFELNNFIKEIFYLSQYLRSAATAKKNIYCLNIAIDKNPPQIYATYKKQNSADVWEKIEGRLAKIYVAPKGVSIISIEPQDKYSVYFYPDGSIDAVTIVFQNKSQEKSSLIIKGALGTIQVK